MKKPKNREERYLTDITLMSRVLVAIFAAMLAWFWVSGSYVPSQRRQVNAEDVLYNGTIMRIDDGEMSEVRIPARFDALPGEALVFETILPDEIEEGTCLGIEAVHQSVYVYYKSIENYGDENFGELIMEYDTEGLERFGSDSANRYVIAPIKSCYAGNVLRIVVINNIKGTGQLNHLYMDTEANIWLYLYKTKGGATIIAFILLVIGVAIILCCEIISIKITKKRVALRYLGWMTSAGAMWILMNSDFRQIFFDNVLIVANMAILVIYLVPISLSLYFDCVQEGRHHKPHVAEIISLLSCAFIIILLHMTGIADMTQTLPVSLLLETMVLPSILGTILFDKKEDKAGNYKYSAYGYIVFMVGFIAEIINWITGLVSLRGCFAGIGLIIFLGFAIYNTVKEVIRSEVEKSRVLAVGEAKANFLSNISYEIRTPVSAMLGMNEMIMKECNDDRILNYAHDIESSGQMLLSTINDIVDYSELERGCIEIHNDEYSLSSLVNDAVNTIIPKLDKKELKFEIEVDENTPDSLVGDCGRISQVIMNLLSNATKYTEWGTITLEFGYEDNGEDIDLVISVTDTGRGIKKEDQDRILESLNKIGNLEDISEQNGWGLPIVAVLVKMMDGHLELNSTYGVGTTFSVRIPQQVNDRIAIGDFKSRFNCAKGECATAGPLFHAKEAKVLAVDDSKVNLTLLQLLLRDTQIQLDTVEGGLVALEKLEVSEYDLVFMDMMMPVMDGKETLDRINEMHPDRKFPVIALTANAVSGAKALHIKMGFDDYISKPVSGRMLEEMLLKWLPEDKVERVTEAKESRSEEIMNVELPQVKGIDWDIALNLLGDVSLVIETVNEIYDNLIPYADELQTYFEDYRDNGNEAALDSYRIKVHGMKSTMAVIGCELSEDAKRLEYAARDGQKMVVLDQTEDFLYNWREYRNLLKPVIGDRDESKSDFDDRAFKEALDAIDVAMETFDVDIADEKIKIIKAMNVPEELVEKVDELAGAIKALDDDKVHELVGKLSNVQ